ncbi:restriction endonuclease subunit S [Serratia rhizosphaerae]
MSWPTISLGELVDIKGGGTPDKSNAEYWNGEIPWASVKDFKKNIIDSTLDSITPLGVKNSATSIIPAGNIIIPTRMALGKVAINAIDIAINQDLKALFIKDYNVVDRNYLFRWLESQSSLIASEGKGATVKGITLPFLKGLNVPIPPLNEQKRIAAILDKADDIRQKREQAIKLADDFLRATFLNMFGDPVENPKGWKVKPLIFLIVGKLQNGAYFPKDKYSKDGVEMVHMADAFYDVIQRGSLKRVQASDADIVKYSLTHEDLMISRRSLNYEGAAKPSLIPQSDEPLIFESSMIRITPDKKQIDKLFLFYYLTDPLVKEHFIRKFVTGATIKGINQKNLEQVRIIVPPLELQKKFSYIVHTLEKHKKKINESEILSIELFTAISQRAFLDQL